MSTSTAIAEQPLSRQAVAAQGRSAPGKVTGKLKAAIHAMVWNGLKRAAAASSVGLAEHSLYVAFTRPHVKAYYLSQLEVLRTSERARNIHTLAEVRDQTANQMARVQAVKALEQISDDPQANGQRVQAPGIVIMVGTVAPGGPVVEAFATTEGERIAAGSMGSAAKRIDDR